MPKTGAIEIRPGRAGKCGAPGEYDIYLHGERHGDIFYNMTGYLGTLPMPSGQELHVGEKGISAYRKAAADLNRQWAAAERPAS